MSVLYASLYLSRWYPMVSAVIRALYFICTSPTAHRGLTWGWKICYFSTYLATFKFWTFLNTLICYNILMQLKGWSIFEWQIWEKFCSHWPFSSQKVNHQRTLYFFLSCTYNAKRYLLFDLCIQLLTCFRTICVILHLTSRSLFNRGRIQLSFVSGLLRTGAQNYERSGAGLWIPFRTMEPSLPVWYVTHHDRGQERYETWGPCVYSSYILQP